MGTVARSSKEGNKRGNKGTVVRSRPGKNKRGNMGHVVRTRQGMEQENCGQVKAKKEIGKVARELCQVYMHRRK